MIKFFIHAIINRRDYRILYASWIVLFFTASAISIVSCKKVDIGSCPNCPQVLSVIPNAAHYNDTVMIIGKHLLPDPSYNDSLTVTFNGTKIPYYYILASYEDSVQVIIPKGTHSGPVKVDINIKDGLTGTTSANFTYLPTFTLTTYAGYKIKGNSDNLDPLLAQFDEPTKIAIDNTTGNLYVYEKNENPGFGNQDGYNLREIAYNGGVYFLKFFVNGGISALACKDGELYCAYSGSEGPRQIGKLVYANNAWNIKHLIGADEQVDHVDGNFSDARFKIITAMSFDKEGNLFITDGNYVRKAAFSGNSGNVSTIAGDATSGFVDNVPPTEAHFSNPYSLVVENNTTIYVSDKNNYVVRKLTPNLVSTIAGVPKSPGCTSFAASSAKLCFPGSIVTDYSGNLFIHESNKPCIRRIDLLADTIGIYAGDAAETGYVDELGIKARFNLDIESTMAYDSTHKILYIADTYNNVIRQIKSE